MVSTADNSPGGAGERNASPNQAWAEVLAAVEADIERTEELLARDSAAVGVVDPPARYVAPAQWQLPPQGPELPPLEQMPDVPAELSGRIHDLRLRIVALQIELSREMAQVRSLQQGPIARAAARRPTPVSAGPARFFDSRA